MYDRRYSTHFPDPMIARRLSSDPLRLSPNLRMSMRGAWRVNKAHKNRDLAVVVRKLRTYSDWADQKMRSPRNRFGAPEQLVLGG